MHLQVKLGTTTLQICFAWLQVTVPLNETPKNLLSRLNILCRSLNKWGWYLNVNIPALFSQYYKYKVWISASEIVCVRACVCVRICVCVRACIQVHILLSALALLWCYYLTAEHTDGPRTGLCLTLTYASCRSHVDSLCMGCVVRGTWTLRPKTM